MAAVDAPLLEYLSRLTGKSVTGDSVVSLGSAKKAQLAAWLRKEGHVFSYDYIDQPKFTAGGLLGGPPGGSPRAEHVPVASPIMRPKLTGSESVQTFPGLRIGIDLESEVSLPAADDYRTNAFYADNFSAREIAYALERSDPRASLCGLWAAKESIVKAGAAVAPANRALKGIEVQHDEAGSPNFPGCALSISHEAGVAVAVCLFFGTAST